MADPPCNTRSAAAQTESGKYVATYGDCRGCHGPDMTGVAASAMAPAVPNPRPSVSTWTEARFAQTMRTGVRPNGAPFTEAMPWQNAARMTDADLAARSESSVTDREGRPQRG